MGPDHLLAASATADGIKIVARLGGTVLFLAIVFGVIFYAMKAKVPPTSCNGTRDGSAGIRSHPRCLARSMKPRDPARPDWR